MCPVAVSHRWTVLSCADARVLPSGENAMTEGSDVWPERVSAVSDSRFRRLTVPSSEAVAKIVPSGEKETARTPTPMPGRKAVCFVLVFKYRTVPSSHPEPKVEPSGEKATLVALPVYRRTADALPEFTSHNLIDSPAPEARVVPSGEIDTDWTYPSCPSRIRVAAVVRSHSPTVPSSCPEASVVPSGEKATERTWEVSP